MTNRKSTTRLMSLWTAYVAP